MSPLLSPPVLTTSPSVFLEADAFYLQVVGVHQGEILRPGLASDSAVLSTAQFEELTTFLPPSLRAQAKYTYFYLHFCARSA